MQLNRFAAIDALAHEVFKEFRAHLEMGQGFTPVLFLHQFAGDDEPELLEMVALENEEQSAWPDIIAEAVSRSEATLWALATQVIVRRSSNERGAQSEEHLFVYVVADAARPESARIWSTRIGEGVELVPPEERTDDPRLQLMLAHLTGGKRLLH